ncbi:hypothetical protein C3473_01395 [Mycobacterium kansasii]|nr:hypothetical protein C3473_01395 [Mycobacterium kansasii]
MLGTHCGRVLSACRPGWPKLGFDGFGGTAKLKVDVISPVTLRRQAVRLGTGTPNRVSSNRSCEVWSNVSWTMRPPRL